MEISDSTRELLFPKLKPEQIARLGNVGKRRKVPAGEVVFDQGSAVPGFFVVLSGQLEIVRPTRDGEMTITVHGPGEFTGEANMLTGRRSLVSGRMATDGELLELGQGCLRHIVQTDSELSEIFLRAFLRRRTQLIANSLGDVVLIGSSVSPDTLRLK